MSQFDPERLLNRSFPTLEQRYSSRDTILYALSVGVGVRPQCAFDLRHCYEEGLEALPSFALVLASPGFWWKDPDTGVDWRRVLHGEQRLELAKPLPASGHVAAEMRVTDVIDKGQGRGALVLSTRRLYDVASGDLIATMASASLCRANGGFGGRNAKGQPPAAIPARSPDWQGEVSIDPRTALLYRLNGDWNPLHADPRVAREAGFERPILHGLATFAIAQVALLRQYAADTSARFRGFAARFAGPIYPGETLQVLVWKGDTGFLVRCNCVEREAVVLDGGHATFVPS